MFGLFQQQHHCIFFTDIYLTKKVQRAERCGQVFWPVPVEKNCEENEAKSKSRHNEASEWSALTLLTRLLNVKKEG